MNERFFAQKQGLAVKFRQPLCFFAALAVRGNNVF
jgi:hypothetical protein